MKTKIGAIAFLFSTAMLVASCGGGGGDDPEPAPPAPPSPPAPPVPPPVPTLGKERVYPGLSFTAAVSLLRAPADVTRWAQWDQPVPLRPQNRNTLWVSVGTTGFAHAPILQVTIAQALRPEVELVAITATFEVAGVNV